MPTVTEVIEKCKAIGLEVRQNPARGGHTLWDIVDPTTGTIITGISSHAGIKGGDRNWHWNIRRNLRRAGFQIDFGDIKRKSRRLDRNPRKKGVIDLEALKIAQEKAEAAGERVPLVDDLDEHPEFFKRREIGGKIKIYTDDATEEAIDQMAPRAEASRFNYTVQRLRTFFDKYEDQLSEAASQRLISAGKRDTTAGRGARSEFVRIAMYDVAPKRNIQAWKSEASGQQSLHHLLDKGDAKGATIWAVNLLEATMDHIEGLKWDEIDESRKKATKPAAGLDVERASATKPPAPEPKPAPEADTATYDVAIAMIEEYEDAFRVIAVEALRQPMTKGEWASVSDKPRKTLEAVMELRRVYEVVLADLERKEETTEFEPVAADGMDEIRQRYADTLLSMLSSQAGSDRKNDQILTLILDRLDKLAGI